MPWDVALQLGSGDRPLFQKIAIAIATDIERGRLLPRTKLASSRALALQLGVNRNTVIAAYDQLCVRGWISIEAARGAFVVGVPATGKAELAGMDGESTAGYPTTPGFDLTPSPMLDGLTPRTPNLLLLLGGVPELRNLPHRELARAYRASLSGSVARRLLDYGDPQGLLRLRTALADLLAHVRGVAAPVDAITIVRGSQHGLYLAARALVRPGDRVAVENPGYRPAWRTLELAGATLVPIGVDREGLDLAALEAACAEQPLRAVYLTPHHQYPTTVTLSADRRAGLLSLARRHRIAVFEDDYDFDFHFEGRPIMPLAAADRAGTVVYFGTLSKSLAPGLRLGYVVAPPAVAREIAAVRRYVDNHGDAVLEHAVATLFEDGEVQRHARRARRIYQARRDAMCEALTRRLPQLAFAVPSGGMALWAAAPGIDTDAWVRRGAMAGVAFQAGSKFSFSGSPSNHVRLGFAACNESELVEAVERMARALS